METGLDSWRGSIRGLYEAFQRSDESLNLLREIDKAIIKRFDGPTSVETVFHRALGELSRIHGLRDPGHCYVYVGDRLLPLSSPSNPDDAALDTPETVLGFAQNPGSESQVLSEGRGDADLFSQLSGARTVLLQPIYEKQKQLLAVLMFADAAPEEGSRLTDPEVCASVQTVARQLSIAYDHFVRADQEERTRELWDLFLNSDLKPTRCFRQLAEMAQRTVPAFGPLKLESPPEVQILVLERDEDEEPHFMTIRGTTGREPVITKIKIEESISGLLVTSAPQEREFFCDDPRKPQYRDLYKSYLGTETREIKSEFAVRLTVQSEAGTELVGILNLESEHEDAFNLHHRAAILDFAARVAPMVEVFEERIEHNRVMQLSVSAVTAKYLDSLASIFRHGIASPLLALKGDVEAAGNILDKQFDGHDEAGKEQLADVLAELRAVHDQIREFTNEFGNEISGFGITGRFDLRTLIGDTVSLARRSLLTTTQAPIEISLLGGPDDEPAYAYCSPLFKQHFFSVLTNAIYSLQEKAEWDPGPRTIEIAIERQLETDRSQEKELNRRWLVRVRDNGVGVSEETLAKLREFKPDSHFRQGVGGMGLGLVALQRYMGSVEGWVRLDSVEGEGFEVRLLFDEYSDDIHGPLSILSRGVARGS